MHLSMPACNSSLIIYNVYVILDASWLKLNPNIEVIVLWQVPLFSYQPFSGTETKLETLSWKSAGFLCYVNRWGVFY